MRALALTACLSLAACHETLVLGTECPEQPGACGVPGDGQPGPIDEPAPSDGGAALDDAASEQNDAGPYAELDAGADDDAPASDADGGDDAALPDLLPFANPSFEVVSGRATGDVSLSPQSSAIAPWYSCRVGQQVRSSAPAGARTVMPTDGSTFLSDSFPTPSPNLHGLVQELPRPLMAGRRYAFMVDLYAADDSIIQGRPQLRIAQSAGCVIPAVELARSREIEPGAWRSECIAFTPLNNVSTIALYVGGDFTDWSAVLYIDNIRLDPSCQ